MKRIGNRVSYIKKPFAGGSLAAAGLVIPAFLLMGAAIGIGYYTQGNAPLYAAGMGLCSIVILLASFSCALFSLFDKEKNYALSKVSLTADGILALIWVVVISAAL